MLGSNELTVLPHTLVEFQACIPASQLYCQSQKPAIIYMLLDGLLSRLSGSFGRRPADRPQAAGRVLGKGHSNSTKDTPKDLSPLRMSV